MGFSRKDYYHYSTAFGTAFSFQVVYTADAVSKIVQKATVEGPLDGFTANTVIGTIDGKSKITITITGTPKRRVGRQLWEIVVIFTDGTDTKLNILYTITG